MNINLRNIILSFLLFLSFSDAFYSKNNDNKYIVRLENYQHTQFYGPLYVGSTKQEMNFVFSTGSNDIWLFSADCANCNTNKLYKYDLSQSFTNYTQSNFIHVIKIISKLFSLIKNHSILLVDNLNISKFTSKLISYPNFHLKFLNLKDI